MVHKFTGLQVEATKTTALETSLIKLKLVLDQWNRNMVTRQQLRELDDNQLRDIGIDRIAADRESGKPFWED